MESILWFLIIGALFFFMMRYGCGAHMGGHGGHGGEPGGGHEGHGGMETAGGTRKVKDPVCGMEIDKDQAYSMVRREGREIYFCSEDCLNQFKQDPKRYF